MIPRSIFRLAIFFVALCVSLCQAEPPDKAKFVVVLYPEANNGSPGSMLADSGIRNGFRKSYRSAVEIHNEFLDLSRFPDARYQDDLARFLGRKYAGRKIDLLIAGLSSGLDYALKYRDEIFPGVPIVFCAIDRKEIQSRQLPADVIGVPIQVDLTNSLEAGFRALPNTRQVYVVVGKSKFDQYWEGEARSALQSFSQRAEVIYLAGLPMAQLLTQLAELPDHSLIYYLHIFEDGDGNVYAPAEALDLIAAKANAPVFCHVDSYIGRGAVGGRPYSFEAAGRNAGELGARLLAGEKPESIGILKPGENAYLFDWRQLRRWGIKESGLPANSVVRFKVPSVWEAYKWQIGLLISVCLLQGLMITGLIAQRLRRERAERQQHAAETGLSQSQATLRELAGKLIGAEESERRRIARELHDDLGQSLALISVELDLLQQKPPQNVTQLGARVAKLSARVKQLSSSIHDLSHQLHPMKLEQLGLVDALRGLCNELSEGHGLTIDFAYDEARAAVAPDISLCVYRVVQEGLQNVIRHSEAQNAAVELRASVDSIRLRIEDDGIGFDISSAKCNGGLGLASMRERVRLVNGQISFNPGSPNGTRIEVRIPLSIGTATALEFYDGAALA